MTRILLLRHAHSVANEKGILAGRTPGVALSEKGAKQSKELVERLQSLKFSRIHISPMERCAETIAPLMTYFSKSTRVNFAIETDPDLVEVDYGKWTGKKLSVLAKDKSWKIVQDTPSAMYFPEGEGLLEVQTRAMRALNRISKTPGKDVKLIVSHGDVIKSIVASVLGTHLDNFQKITIDPASITILDYNGKDYRVLTLNNTSQPITNFLVKPQQQKNFKALLGGGSGRER